ncbi:MAG TPA: aminotransferase class I/II-fold pyridoxal phosphate-dependent enzyme [Vicinamibacterales bacterium]|nr:aminotransferase class I/II-fold pyridoxal phosphate-dependent enzyme [Vicinamibacterales bacterium]
MQIEQFDMERMQSTYENLVSFNLSESGVHPLRLHDLVGAGGSVEALLGQRIGYTQSNGTVALREAIARLYPGATPDHLEVTNGGSEANLLVTWHLVSPGDEVVIVTPNYLQTWGLARGFGGRVRACPLRAVEGPRRWAPDLDELRALVTPQTRLIVICNPNNPTGARLQEAEVDAICAIAARHGTWLLADEIYRGAELDGHETPSAWGRYERVIVTSGLSKAYGLPGLRIGWIAGPPDLIAQLWMRHDYTTICPGALSDYLARIALQPERRAQLLERTRGILRTNWPVMRDWLASRGSLFSYVPPEAGAIVYVRYHHAINSTTLVTRLREEKSVLVVPGDHFGMDGYLRIGYGEQPAYLHEALGRVADLLADALQTRA